MSAWTDITRPLDDGLPCWPGRTPPRCTWEKRMDQGAHCNVSTWAINAHTGTHIDAPLHFIEGGDTIDQIPPEVLIGDCAVVDARDQCTGTLLQAADVEGQCGVRRLLVRTDHSDLPRGTGYPPHGPLMTPDAARILLAGGLQLIGTDRLSVDGTDSQDFSLHHAFLGAGCLIVEGLALTDVASGGYTLCLLPLRLAGAEASPARALLAHAGTIIGSR